MNFFEEYKKQLFIIACILLIIVALVTAGNKTNATVIDNAFSVVVVPLQKAATTVSSFFEDKITALTKSNELVAENESLKQQIAQLESDTKLLERYQEENARLSELLEISQKYNNYETTGANVIAKDPGNWYTNFTLDKGTKDGLSANMVLISSGGLIGKITETGYGYAKAQSILDSRSSVSAVSVRTNDLGIVKGDYSLMEQGLCRMEYIDADAEIMEGDEIVTSHLSDTYPPGITIGVVKEIRSDVNGLTKYAIIEPQVDLKHLDTVLVISETFEKTTAETGE